MNAKKKPQENPPSSARATQPIRLKPSTSDYATFAKTTANAMGRSEPDASALKPNKRLLSLVNLES